MKDFWAGRQGRMLFALALVLTPLLATAADWPSYGHDAQRTGKSDETILSPANAAQLTLRWTYKTGGVIASSPTVVGGVAYVGSWDGYEYALNAQNGTFIWRTYLGITSAPNCNPKTAGISSVATVQNGVVYVGGGDAYWYALDASTGTVLWKVYTGDNSATGGHYNWASPLIANGYAYIGISSFGDCPLVPGQLLQVSLTTHQIVHTATFVPSGQTGGTIWTSPTLDATGQTVFVTSGTATLNNATQPQAQAMVALDAGTLAIKGFWRVPAAQAVPDSDWGTTPNVFPDGHGINVVAGADKNGYLYAFDQANITAGPLWQTKVGDGGSAPQYGTGMVSTGTFANGTLYMASGNVTVNGTKQGGSVNALDPFSGAYRWRHYTPSAILPALAYVNGLVIDGPGATLEVLNASTGAQLYHYTTGGQLYGHPSVANGQIFEGSTDGNVYAFGLPGTPPATATATNTPPPATATATSAPPVATNTSPAATSTNTNTPPVATATATNTPPAATSTNTPPAATATATATSPVATNTPPVATATATSTNTPPVATATATNTPATTTLFATGFESGDPQPTWTNTVDTNSGGGGILNVGGICCGLSGPEAGPRIETSHTGRSALMYSGNDTSASGSYAYLKVFDLSAQNIVVGPTTTLSYWIYPQSSTSNGLVSGGNSSCIALDLVFTDGANLHSAGAVDQGGRLLTPPAQCGRLTLDTWNHVTSVIGAVATSKTISRLDVGYDQAANTRGYRGYIDDISIQNSSSPASTATTTATDTPPAATATDTPPVATSTNTSPAATATATATSPVATNTPPVATATATSTNTPPVATATATSTDTPPVATATATNTPAATALFATGFESGDPQLTWISTVDSGPYPAGGLVNVAGICCGFSGPEAVMSTDTNHMGSTALRYSGLDKSASSSYAYLKVFDLGARNIVVGPTTTLSYWIYPQSSTSNGLVSGSNSSCVAIDLVFTNGTNLRDSGTVDQNGVRLHPAYQCGRLTLDTWNHVTSVIGVKVAGRTISRLDVGYDQAANTGGYRGYIDDISIQN